MLWFGMVWYGTYLMNMVSYILERSHNRRYIHITLLSYLIYADMHHTILRKIPNTASAIYVCTADTWFITHDGSWS